MTEKLKSALIALLALSLLMLTFAIWQHDAPAQWDSAGPMAAAARTLGMITPPPKTLSLTAAVSEAARPARVVWTHDGQHWGAQYDNALLDGVYDLLKESLGGALGSAGQPVAQTAAAWREALSGNNLYLEYNNPLPLRTLALWLSAGASSLPDTPVRRLAVVSEQDAVALWFVDPSGAPYRCPTAVPALDITSAVPSGLLPCRFGFESELPRTPHALLFDSPPSPPEASCLPAALGSPDAFLQALRFKTDPEASFPNDEGGMTYVDGMRRTCRFSRREHIRYVLAPTEWPVAATDTPEAIEQARALLATLSPLLGEARFSLQSAVESEDGTVTVTFGYELSGIPVHLSDDTPPAVLIFRTGQLIEANIRVLSFSLSDTNTPLLPENWAYVLLTVMRPQEKLELGLTYKQEEDGRLNAGWSLE